jgi:hypothetical protein
MNENSIVKRMFGGTVAVAALAAGVLATLPAQHDGPSPSATIVKVNDEIPPDMTQPGQSNPSTSIQPPGSPSNPASPDMDAIHQDVMP